MLQEQRETGQAGPTNAEPMSTAPDTTTEHTTFEEQATHVTRPTQEQQERHGPKPTSTAPTNDDCESTVSEHSGPTDATDSGRTQQVGGGGLVWSGSMWYFPLDDDEPAQD
jgi:hypothetical protein